MGRRSSTQTTRGDATLRDALVIDHSVMNWQSPDKRQLGTPSSGSARNDERQLNPGVHQTGARPTRQLSWWWARHPIPWSHALELALLAKLDDRQDEQHGYRADGQHRHALTERLPHVGHRDDVEQREIDDQCRHDDRHGGTEHEHACEHGGLTSGYKDSHEMGVDRGMYPMT